MTRILVADDNDQNLFLLETVMESYGYEVIPARNGVEAFALALKNPPDLILTDILMPEMDGLELCRRCKAHDLLNHIPLIFYTATYTDPKDEQFALSLGAERFIIKPQSPKDLVQIVQEVLDNPLKGRQVSSEKSPGDETKVLQQYNEVLFRKLEKKVLQLEDVIVKQKRTENELRESEQKYRTLVTQSPDGIFVVNLKGKFLAVNRIMCENMKYSEEELLSMSIWDIVAEQYVDIHKKRIADILTGKAPNEAAEYLVRGKDGNQHYVEILSAPYYEGKELIGFQGIARDITERKQADEAILRSKMLLQSVIDSTPDWMYVKDFQHKFLLVNRSFAEAQHLTPQDIIGKADTDLFSEEMCLGNPDKGILGFHNDDNQAFQGQMVHNPRNIVTWADDSLHIYDTYKIPLADQSGKIYAALVYSRDMTEQRKAEDEREASFRTIQKTLHDVINTMAKIVEMRDPYTSGHQARVAALAGAIAREMKLDDTRVEHLVMAASIHDVGKMNVPSDILSKPGKLSDIEWAMIKTHPQGGYDILKDVEFSQPLALMVLQHHERLNGSGYPNGLKGNEMLLEAKILAVADVVEAMYSHRPYRPALGIDKALNEISQQRGILYDPDVVDTCMKLFKEQGYKFK